VGDIPSLCHPDYAGAHDAVFLSRKLLFLPPPHPAAQHRRVDPPHPHLHRRHRAGVVGEAVGNPQFLAQWRNIIQAPAAVYILTGQSAARLKPLVGQYLAGIPRRPSENGFRAACLFKRNYK